jgi:ATP-dependent helicase/DNAse subunit B
MLSVNEGMMPKNANDSSFIPYHLKKAFGLTTLEHKMAVYAFYFYRLLQRAEKITFMYNTANGGTSKNEMSRFLRQLLAETDSEIHLRTIKLSQDIKKPVSLIVNKTPEIMRTLWENYTGHYANGNPRMLSPSALNAYIDCPMKFYFQQVAKLHVEKNPEDGLDAALFGTIFHESAERVYLSMMTRGNHIRKQDIEHILENEDTLIMPHVEAAFLKNFFDNEPKKVFYNGQLLVAKKVIARYIKQLLRNELKSIDLIVKDMEKPHFRVIEINSGNTVHSIQIGGKIDKMDYVKMADEASGQLTETLRIIDYKTGGKIKKPTNMYSLFTPDKDRANYVFQAFLYSWVMCAEEKRPISPLLFYVNHSSLPDYDPIVLFNGEQVKDFKPLADDFENELRKLLEEQIFNPELPFKQTETKGACTFCDYKLFCGK